jgi:predicted metalloprotease with PDZ domain
MSVQAAILAIARIAVVLAGIGAAAAQTPPQPVPDAPAIPAPRDTPYPGMLRLSVDATDLNRDIFRVHETVPVTAAGPFILLYPKWLPGDHAPSLPIEKLAGLDISAGGQRIPWRRDPVDLSAFHIDIPKGATALDVNFQFLSAISARDWPRLMTPNMFDVWWPYMVLYPAGHFARRIMVDASIKLPAGFKSVTSLETASSAGQVVRFKPTDLETLVDSPVAAGLYLRQYDLAPRGAAPVRLNLFADRPTDLSVKPELISAYQAMVRQAQLLFGSHHYDHYDFLSWLSNDMSQVGLEHQQSSEDGFSPSYFSAWDGSVATHDTAPHEYTHSWNGKFRRPAELWTPNFDVPMRDGLLWVYEGQTEYWGRVLAARSGLLTRQQFLDALATVAATAEHQAGNAWRPLADTTNDPIFTAARRPRSWPSWQRNEDYYWDGLLLWLDADTLIREKSHGTRSLDDFAKAFFGISDGSRVISTYDFDDVVGTLNEIQSYDWASLLHARLDQVGKGAPLDGLARGGYRLVYTAVESDYSQSVDAENGAVDLSFSLGMTTSTSGTITDVTWDGPAFKAGLVPGMQLTAVNGIAFGADAVKHAVEAAARTGPALEFLVKRGERYQTIAIKYRGGLRYPHLQRIPNTPAHLDDILTARI